MLSLVYLVIAPQIFHSHLLTTDSDVKTGDGTVTQVDMKSFTDHITRHSGEYSGTQAGHTWLDWRAEPGVFFLW